MMTLALTHHHILFLSIARSVVALLLKEGAHHLDLMW